MPIYEYVCQSCHHRFEVKQSLTEQPLSSCRRCGGAVTKVISPPAIMFKGTGWYVTDYSDKLKPPAESKPETAGTDGQKPQADKAASPSSPSSGSDAGSSPAKTESGPSTTVPSPTAPSK